VTLATLNTLAEAAVAALEAGDYATAIRVALSCKPLLAVTPNLSRASEGNSQTMAFTNVEAIDAFIKECRILQTAAACATDGPFTQSLIRYKRPDEETDYE
jgi:hypothetical protein